MHAAIFVLALLSQNGAPPATRLGTDALDRFTDYVEQQHDDIDRAVALSKEQAFEEHEFIEHFNELVTALSRFSKKYRSDHVIDVKAVESVRKAYEKLERCDAWFKTERYAPTKSSTPRPVAAVSKPGGLPE